MALEPDGNGEICSVTGTEANARFERDLGFAWYESRYDTSLFVDISGKYDGPVCDDVIEQALKDGEIFVYAYASGGFVSPDKLPAEAAAIVFSRAALRQASFLVNPPKRTSVGIGMVFYEDAAELKAPGWLAPLVRFSGRNSLQDFDYAGCLWSLSTLAKGEDVTEETAIEAGLDMHEFAVRAFKDEAMYDEMLIEGMSKLQADLNAEVDAMPPFSVEDYTMVRDPGETDEEYAARLEAVGSAIKGL